MRPNKLKTDNESARICCQFSAKAKRNVHQLTAHSISLFGEVSQGGKHPPWPEESKETSGFVAGNPTGTASPWHTTLLAKYSVLYLHPRLTGKRSVSMQERSFCLAGKRAGFASGNEQKHDRFQEWGQGYKPRRSGCSSINVSFFRCRVHAGSRGLAYSSAFAFFLLLTPGF